MNELSISQKYPVEKYNLLGNTDVMVEIPDIKAPVIQAIRLETDPAKGDVYIQQNAKKEWTDDQNRRHPATPDRYAITKNGLKKLADGAGITMLSSQHVVPTTCQKCVAVNQYSGKVVQCGNCKNRDVAYHVTICVPQLTGKDITVEDIARRCKLDRSYFGKVFKKAVGQSPQEFLIRYRMSKAADALIIGDDSVGDIGASVGYPNLLHFSRAFKGVYGVSPREYRQKNKIIDR